MTPVKNSVPGDLSLSVPQELLDYILDFLHDDIPTLQTCSLVSHAFLPCSRYHIYSSVFIVHVFDLDRFRDQYVGQLFQIKNLVALLEYSPHVAPLVTRFGIHGHSEWMTDIVMDTSLFPIIQSLRNLSHIEIICHRYRARVWNGFPVASLRVFFAALRSVSLKTFICSGIAFQTLEQFEDLFTAAANPALKHLSLACKFEADNTSKPYPPIRPPRDGLPALESLSIAGDAISRNIAWLLFKQSQYDIRGIRHLSLQIYDGTTSSLIQRLLNEMQGTLESFTLDVIAWADTRASLDLSRHEKMSSFLMILTSPVDPRLLGARLSPMLRTFVVEQVCHGWERVFPQSVRAWAEFDAHLDGLRLRLALLQRVHVRLHDSRHGVCCGFKCHGREHGMCDCRECECDRVLCDRYGHKVAVDHDKWKCQVEEIMPLLRGRGILEVEVVKQRYCIPRAFD